MEIFTRFEQFGSKKSDMDNRALMYREIMKAFTDRNVLKAIGTERDAVSSREAEFAELASDILRSAGGSVRFRAEDILRAGVSHLEEMRNEPEGGWSAYCYRYVLHRLFPHLEGPAEGDRQGADQAENVRRTADRAENGRQDAGYTDNDSHYAGCHAALALLRGVFSYERLTCSFDPTLDFDLLSDAEVRDGGFTSEYIKMRRLARLNYIYEFMRLGAEVTPFNTLGHVAGVHYTATYVARQLRDSGIPVDLALISGAAASHDIGKYGCRKSEERRVPYLHYYYTNYCMTRNGLPEIAHIAANHSTWDLEIENLSVESLLLIYADFRVKSTRDPGGAEVIRFYTLAEAFDVILGKLDNVDEAKRHRYETVYARLKDFEDYMKEHGVHTDLPCDAARCPDTPVRVRRMMPLLHGDDIVTQLRYKAIDHNIRVMHHFSSSRDFNTLIENARSVNDWKDLRTYITLLGDYSTYMTEEQKAMTLRFLYDQLSHAQSDIREQSARQMGQITATFREAYKKELPEDIPKLDETTTNLEMFGMYLDKMLSPSSKLADQHRYWIMQCLDFYVKAAVESCAPQFRSRYLDIIGGMYTLSGYDERAMMSVLMSALAISTELFTGGFRDAVLDFAGRSLGKYSESIDLLILDLLEHICGPDEGIAKERRRIMGISHGDQDDSLILSAMFLDDLKFRTSWITKLSNIRYMSRIAEHADSSTMLHIATHLVNLIKVSETITMRKEAGKVLLGMAGRMTHAQLNEVMVELFKGLDVEDYQFSRAIPDILGSFVLHLPPEELDELITELENNLNTGTGHSAASSVVTLAVILENYSSYVLEHSQEARARRTERLTGLLIKGCVHYRRDISREAFRAVGRSIFSSKVLTMREKRDFIELAGKRIMLLIPDDEKESSPLEFYNNASFLSRMYRFISSYTSECGEFRLAGRDKVAFFPGTFDPFSLGHKAIARTIRDKGFEVYLAIDEFSWSKKTLPHMRRREIVSMSIADEKDIYIFPDDVPVNIANTDNLRTLRELFDGRSLYIAVGSDVVRNASAYRAWPSANSIHGFNHIIFDRSSGNRGKGHTPESPHPIRGDVLSLTLKRYYEDISSTRIRENIDRGRDISSLIDPIVQSYIYDNKLYVRQPAYKHEIQAKDISISSFEHKNYQKIAALREELERSGYDYDSLIAGISRPRVKTVCIESADHTGSVYAFASAKRVERHDLLFEFNDADITTHIRDTAAGSIAVISSLYSAKIRHISNLTQIILTELLTDLLAQDYGYAIYNPSDPAGMNPSVIEALRRQGFINISGSHDHPVYAVDMTLPIVIFRDVETVLKAPVNKSPRVRKAIDDAHNRLLRTLNELYPGKLILSFNTSAVYSKIAGMVAAENGVPATPDPARRRGPYMAVPFGKALDDVVVPNTVTKALRTEKYFNEITTGFSIREWPGYTSLDVQAETLRSFDRPVILIDDLLHSGQRMKHIDQLLREHDVTVQKVIVGLLTGNARDDLIRRKRSVEGAYFIPSISMWLNERDCYPFIGGDSVDNENGEDVSVNLIMPYAACGPVGELDPERIYRYSMTCLENARSIMRAIEHEYQTYYEKQLTVARLGEVITRPRKPDYGRGVRYDESVAPSSYLESDILHAQRLILKRK